MNSIYTEEQKHELSQVFARLLYELTANVDHSEFMGRLAVQFLAEIRNFPWCVYHGNEHGVLRHMEEAGVYGVYHFYHDKRTSLYMRAIYSDKFCRYMNQPRRPSLEAFLKAFPKSAARKPTRELMIGNVSSVGKARTNINRV